MIEFHLDNHSGVAPYLQLVQQVKQALRRSLVRWLHSAYEAGLDGESVLALFMSTFEDTQKEHEGTA